MNKLTFAFDCELSDTEYIPANTVVEVYKGYQPYTDSTNIVYKGNVIGFMNCAFVELRSV